MRIVKNSFGTCVTLSPKFSTLDMVDKFVGSSLDRKPTIKKEKEIEIQIEEIRSEENLIEKAPKLRSMSNRTKSKIRKKIFAVSQLENKLTFVTLTFCNQVDDKKALKLLSFFLENASKLALNFQYLWVAERQTKNKIFKDNIHFHIITNKQRWDINKWLNYWLLLQAKHGLISRDPTYKASSGFDVKRVHCNHIKGIVTYLTKYVTKNSSQFNCQVWNCSLKISKLYTDFFTTNDFLEHFKILEKANLLGGKIKTYLEEYYRVDLIPLNQTTMNFYIRLYEKNKNIWNS
jgi:hypothetical protein